MSAQRSPRRKSAGLAVPVAPSEDASYAIKYFKRAPEDDPKESIPGRVAKASWPKSVQAKVDPVLIAVAEAPPHRFSGGGYWEAMKDDMAGIYEARWSGPPRRHHYRLFCVLDQEAIGQTRPWLVVLTGADKPDGTVLKVSEYAEVRALANEYFRRNPRSVA